MTPPRPSGHTFRGTTRDRTGRDGTGPDETGPDGTRGQTTNGKNGRGRPDFLDGWPDEILERYQIRAVLGMGGMGVVLQAHDRTLARMVAIKAVRIDAARGEDLALRARLRREIHLLQKLSHPAIVRLLDGAIWPGGELLVMEWIDGAELSIPMPARWDAAGALRFMARVADGLAHAHERQIIHRDLKPQNLLVTRDDAPKILDLGLARGFGDMERTALTATGSVLGTPAWLPPECLEGRPLSAPSDLFQLGLITQDLLSGRPHQEGLDLSGIMSGTMHRSLLEGAHLPPGLHPELAELLRRCLALDPAARPSATAFRDALQAFLGAGSPVFPGSGSKIGTVSSTGRDGVARDRKPPSAGRDGTGGRPAGEAASPSSVPARDPSPGRHPSSAPARDPSPGRHPSGESSPTGASSPSDTSSPSGEGAGLAEASPSTGAHPSHRPGPSHRLLLAVLALVGLVILGLGASRTLSPPRLVATRIVPAHREITVRLDGDRPRPMTWRLFDEEGKRLLKRGSFPDEAAERELRLRALRPGRAYRLVVALDGVDMPPLELATLPPSWPLPPRAHVLGNALLLRWHGLGVGPQRWTLRRDGKMRAEGRGEERGEILIRRGNRALQAHRWTWELEDEEGARLGPGEALDWRIDTDLPRVGPRGHHALPRDRARPPLPVENLLVGVNREGRLYATGLPGTPAATAPLEPSWRSPLLEMPPGGRLYYSPPVLDPDGTVWSFLEAPPPHGGPRRFVRDETHPPALRAMPPLRPDRRLVGTALDHAIAKGRCHRLAWTRGADGALTIVVETHPLDGGPSLRTEALLRELVSPSTGLGPLVDPLLSALASSPAELLDEADPPEMPCPATAHGADRWMVLALHLKPDPRRSSRLKRAFLLMRHRPDARPKDLRPVALVATPGPPPGTAVLGDSLWVAAGRRLLRLPARGAPRALSPDPTHGIWFFGPPFMREGKPHVWLLMGIASADLRGELARLHHAPRWALARIDDEADPPRLHVWPHDIPTAVTHYLNKARPERCATPNLEICVADEHLLAWHADQERLVVTVHGHETGPSIALLSLPGAAEPLLALQSRTACHLRPLALLGEGDEAPRRPPTPPVDLPLLREPLELPEG